MNLTITLGNVDIKNFAPWNNISKKDDTWLVGEVTKKGSEKGFQLSTNNSKRLFSSKVYELTNEYGARYL